jgi:hypothetical protein
MDNDEDHAGHHETLLAFGLPYDMTNTKKMQKVVNPHVVLSCSLCLCCFLNIEQKEGDLPMNMLARGIGNSYPLLQCSFNVHKTTKRNFNYSKSLDGRGTNNIMNTKKVV